jgi:hypothetical protein
MTVTSTVIEDTAGFTGYEDVDDATGAITYRRVWKPGSTGANRQALHDKLAQAVSYFGGNYTNWPTMTAAQKDAANRQAQRALANLAQFLLGQFGDPGA